MGRRPKQLSDIAISEFEHTIKNVESDVQSHNDDLNEEVERETEHLKYQLKQAILAASIVAPNWGNVERMEKTWEIEQ